MGSKTKNKAKNKQKKPSSTTSKKKEDQKTQEEASGVDFGATADAYAADDSSMHDDDEDEEDTSLEMAEANQDDSSVNDNDNENDKGEEEVEEEEASSDDDDDDEEDEQATDKDRNTFQPAFLNDSEEPCTFDLRNLTAVNSHPLHQESLYKKTAMAKKKTKDSSPEESEKLTIHTAASLETGALNEEYLLAKATEGCAQLIQALWQLPNERSDAGPMVHLPTFDQITIPRALPPPAPKADTKWEKFAKEKGIPLNKEKRSRKVWDEVTNSWKFRHGFEKANADANSNNWPIMEVGGNDDPFADPWQKQRDSKFARTEQNRENQMKNQERAGVLPKGTTRRVLKSRAETRQSGKEGGRKGIQQELLPVGVPVDLTENKLRGQASVNAALKATQKSTASLGRFDKPLEGEPERKFPVAKKKRKFMADASTSGNGSSEQARVAKVLQTVLQGGGVETEKARKKGKLAKGVTPYDYEYDDGGNKVLFKKKKGRGGIGKNKKMTKKRIK